MAKAFVLLNPFAGSGSPDRVLRTVQRHLDRVGWTYQIQQASEAETIRKAVTTAVEHGADLCVVAGGDGTISRAGSALVNTAVPLAILPSGTGNVLARDLGIPVALEDALRLLSGTHQIRAIDAMAVGERFLFIALGVGVSGHIMRDTGQAEKRRFGRMAYLWIGFKALLGLQPRTFRVRIDGVRHRFRAAEVLVANLGAVGEPAIRWGPQVRVDDGAIDVCVVRARSLFDLVRIASSVLLGRQRSEPNLRFLSAQHQVYIATRVALPVQGDGDFIGHTPVHIRIVPSALQVIVPSKER